MNHAYIKYIFIVIISMINLSCNTEKNKSGVIIGKVGGEDIYLNDIDRLQVNANKNDTLNSTEWHNFLTSGLYYMAMLKEAYNLKYDEDDNILKEVTAFRQDLVKSFWYDKITESMVHTMKENYSDELKLSFIVFPLSKDASPQEIITATQKGEKIKERYLSGEPFSTLIQEYTQSGTATGGSMDYITAGTKNELLENKAYTLNMTDKRISDPLYTQYGVHILYLEDKRPRRKDRFVSHILIPGTFGVDPQYIVFQADKIYDTLIAGEPWDKMVKLHSKDITTSSRQGKIGWITYGTIPDNLVKYIMNMNEIGKVYPPTYSSLGVHIFKLDSIRQNESKQYWENLEYQWREELKRFSPAKLNIYPRILEFLGQPINEINVNKTIYAIKLWNNEKLSTIKLNSDINRYVLFEFDKKTFRTKDFLAWLQKTSPDLNARKVSIHDINDYIVKQIDKYLPDFSMKNDLSFSQYIENYQHDAMVFKIMQTHINTMDDNDISILKNMYNQSDSLYQYGTRYAISKLWSPKKESIIDAQNKIEKNDIEWQDIRRHYNDVWTYQDTLEQRSIDHIDIQRPLKQDIYSNIVKEQNGYSIYYLRHIIPPRKKTFNEVREQLFFKYYPTKEERYHKKLKEKYNIQLYPISQQDAISAEI